MTNSTTDALVADAIHTLAVHAQDPHDWLAAWGKAHGAGIPIEGIQRYMAEDFAVWVALPCANGIVKASVLPLGEPMLVDW